MAARRLGVHARLLQSSSAGTSGPLTRPGRDAAIAADDALPALQYLLRHYESPGLDHCYILLISGLTLVGICTMQH